MPSSRENESAPERDLQDTRDDLAQASIALNTAYDRLQGLRASLRSFTAQRDRLSGFRRPHHQTRLQSDELMRPEHSAIILSDSEDESEIDMEALRESIPTRLLELTSRWGNQHARLTAAARQVTAADTRNYSSSLYSSAVSSDEARLVFPPPPRRRRPPPPATPSSRDGAVLPPPNVVSPARIGMLEAHVRELRRLRLASTPGDSSTSLGRRVAQRQAAANERSEHQMHGPGTGATSESIVRSTLPLGLEPRPTPPPRSYGSTNLLGIESRAATHLRHSLLPTPPAGIRLGMPNRVSSSNGAHTRFNDRLERTRIARSNSLTALSHGPSPTPTLVQDNHAPDVSTQPPLSPRTRATNAWEETSLRSVFLDSNPNYPARRRVRNQGQEEARDMNWREIMLQGNGDEILDAPTWLRPHLRQILRVGSRSSRVQPELDTDRANQSPQPASNETNTTGQEGSVQRRRTRGWGMFALLDHVEDVLIPYS